MAPREGQAVMERGGQRAGEQTRECAMAGRAPPEHAEQEGGEQRGVHEAEHQLEHVHDVVEGRCHVGAATLIGCRPP